MKEIMQFLFAAFLFSCTGPSRPLKKVEPIDDDLKIVLKTISTNTYTKSGLLDSTYQIDSSYFKGIFAIDINSIITRAYDNRNNLVNERTFEISKPNYIVEEKIFSYDIENNLISEIDKSNGITRSIEKKYYNEHNQEIKSIWINNNRASYPEGDIRGRSNPEFDTTISVYSYDSQGNLIKQTTSNSNDVNVFTLFTSYSNGQKSFSYELDEIGDTLTTSKYKKMENLIEETFVDKFDPNGYTTSWYDGKKIMKHIFYDSKANKKYVDIYKYDEKGNEIEHISYKNYPPQ